MMKKIATLACILTILYAPQAFSYQRDVRPSRGSQDEPAPSPPPVPDERGGGRGLIVAGYTMIGLGGAAAIAGSALAMTNSKRTAGIIVGSTGAALGLAGSIVLLFSFHDGYGIAPQIDPSRNQYGLAFAANF